MRPRDVESRSIVCCVGQGASKTYTGWHFTETTLHIVNLAVILKTYRKVRKAIR